MPKKLRSIGLGETKHHLEITQNINSLIEVARKLGEKKLIRKLKKIQKASIEQFIEGICG